MHRVLRRRSLALGARLANNAVNPIISTVIQKNYRAAAAGENWRRAGDGDQSGDVRGDDRAVEVIKRFTMLKLVLTIISFFVLFVVALGGLALIMVKIKRARRARRNRQTAEIRKYHREVQKIMREERKQKVRGTYESAPDVKLNFPLGSALERLINR